MIHCRSDKGRTDYLYDSKNGKRKTRLRILICFGLMFLTNVHILYPLKTPETKGFLVFSGV